GHGSSLRRHSDASLRPKDVAGFVPRAPARLERAHAGLVEQIALEPVRIAVAGPSLETKEWRAGPCPQRGVRKARVLHRNRRARRGEEGERPPRAAEEERGGARERLWGDLETAARKRNRTLVFLPHPPGPQPGTLGLPLLPKTKKTPAAPRR